MQAGFADALEDLESEIGLAEHLTAGEGDAAARIVVEVAIAHDNRDHLVDRHLLARDAHGIVRADLDAVAAGVAERHDR